MEWLVIGAIAWFVMKHHNPGLGANVAGSLGGPSGPMVPIGPAPPIGGGTGISPNGNPGIIPPGLGGSDVVGSNSNPYGRGFGNTVGQTQTYPAGPQNWLPVRNPGAAVAGSSVPGATGSAQDLGGDAPPVNGQVQMAGYIIGRGY